VFCATDPSGCSTDSGTGGGSNEEYATVVVLGSNISGLTLPPGLTSDGLLFAGVGEDVSLDGVTFRAAS
jgi:hypothetical protein